MINNITISKDNDSDNSSLIISCINREKALSSLSHLEGKDVVLADTVFINSLISYLETLIPSSSTINELKDIIKCEVIVDKDLVSVLEFEMEHQFDFTCNLFNHTDFKATMKNIQKEIGEENANELCRNYRFNVHPLELDSLFSEYYS